MRKLSEIMELMLPLYNPWLNNSYDDCPAQFYFCDCANNLYSGEHAILVSEMDVVHRHIKNLIQQSFCLIEFLFDIAERDNLTEDQKIQMVMFWINEIETLKENNL